MVIGWSKKAQRFLYLAQGSDVREVPLRKGGPLIIYDLNKR
jgi:hypothetical protein